MSKGLLEQLSDSEEYTPLTMKKLTSIVEEMLTPALENDILQYRINSLVEVAKDCPYDMEVNDYLEKVSPSQFKEVKAFNDAMRQEHLAKSEEYLRKAQELHDRKMKELMDGLPDRMKI